jgi:hypothetical protein
MELVATKVWTYWISLFIFIPVLLLLLGMGVLYLVRVVGTKYPRR